MFTAASLIPQSCAGVNALSDMQYAFYASGPVSSDLGLRGKESAFSSGIRVANTLKGATRRTVSIPDVLVQFSSFPSQTSVRNRGNHFSADQSVVALQDRDQASDQGNAKTETLSSNSLLLAFSSATNTTVQSSPSLTISVVPNCSIVVRVGNLTYATDPLTGKVTVIARYNETFEVSVPQKLDIQPGVRITFNEWDNGDTNSSRAVTVNSNLTLTATYTRQYFVSVLSQYGAPVGSGWFDENSLDSVSIAPVIDGGVGIRYVFEGWSGGIAGDTDPISFQVTGPMNLTALWTTFNLMRFTFYDGNSTAISPGLLDSLTLRAPNGTVVLLSNLESNSSFWFAKGDYDVLTAYVYGVDSAAGSEHFTTSPSGVARIRLELYTLSFRVIDCIFGSPVDGGTVTITLPNGQAESATINGGQAVFGYLPAALYSFNVSRSWSMGVSGSTSLPNQSDTTVGLVVIPSLILLLLSSGIAVTTATVVLRRRGRTRKHATQARRDRAYSDYWNRQEVSS